MENIGKMIIGFSNIPLLLGAIALIASSPLFLNIPRMIPVDITFVCIYSAALGAGITYGLNGLYGHLRSADIKDSEVENYEIAEVHKGKPCACCMHRHGFSDKCGTCKHSWSNRKLTRTTVNVGGSLFKPSEVKS